MESVDNRVVIWRKRWKEVGRKRWVEVGRSGNWWSIYSGWGNEGKEGGELIRGRVWGGVGWLVVVGGW